MHDLELKSLRKEFPGGVVAVDSFDLQVEKGEFISFIGPSGCGKTTTLRMIAGFETQTEGHILIKGQDISEVPAERRPVSTIFQNYALFPHMNVRQNIEFGLEIKGMPPGKIREKSDRIMEKLDLADVADGPHAALSGGQRQRVALARGLVVEPDILLLDEPLGALDANLRKSIQHELRLLQRNLDITFIFVTHAQSEALALSDRVVVMNNGKTEQVASSIDLYTRPRTEFVARFIGKNTLLYGKVAGTEGGLVTLETDHGSFTGESNMDGPAAQGAECVMVIPSERVLLAHQAPDRQDGQANSMRVVLKDFEVVANVMHASISLPDGRAVRVESHQEKHSGSDFRPGEDILMNWKAGDATVIPKSG